MANTYSKIYLHIVFHIKDGVSPILAQDFDTVHNYIAGTINNIGGNSIVVGGISDHVHILVNMPKTLSVSDFVRTIKAGSSKWIKSIDEQYYRHFAWQDGYGVFSVSQSLVPKTEQYIRNQQSHHHKMTWREEYILFLKEYELDYDERYL